MSLCSIIPAQASIYGVVKPLVRFHRFADLRMLKILNFEVFILSGEERRPEDSFR
ncbi:unnamed protein product [Arabidopsis lyrata]|nr:unnamed protein product [Arabidopsis lyrata]